MLILNKPNSKKKPNNMSKKELAGLRESWEKQMGLKEPRKGSSKTMGIMWCKKVKMGHNMLKVRK